ncbi:MAG: amidohydrolase [Lachnospiraceae bacterium]|nr:amidohydrolase [Lachnospiraceae bacterium]
MKDRLSQLIDEKRAYFCRISDEIWANPELNYREHKATEILIKALAENGFEIEKDIIGIPTAFKATFGSGKPVIGFLGEYDALDNLSQEAGNAERCPVVAGAPGHGCGHNAIGTCCLAACVAMKEYMEENGLEGTIVYYGCPAEEQGCGKSFMTREGVFEGLDIAFAPHPMGYNTVFGTSALANIQAEFTFKGIASHAAAAPEHGRSALDAAELMVIGVQFLREHVVQEARIHHAFLDAGGVSPNVVQQSAKLLFYTRAPKSSQVREIFERMKKIAHGAAMMTETEVQIDIKSGMTEVISNPVLGELTADAWAELGPIPYSAESREIAAKMAPTVGNTSGMDIDEGVPAFKLVDVAMAGSTDVGDVSFVVPTIMIYFAGCAKGTPPHSWQFTAQSGSSIMHDGMIHTAKIMALAAMKIVKDPSIADQAKDALDALGLKYDCLIPAEIWPEIPEV